MRRVTFALFVCLAACGGTDMVNSPARASRAAGRQAFLLSAEARRVIASFSRVASEDAIDTCLNAWGVGDVSQSPAEGDIFKPDVTAFRAYLADCLGVPDPGPDARTNAGNLRDATGGDLRIGMSRSF